MINVCAFQSGTVLRWQKEIKACVGKSVPASSTIELSLKLREEVEGKAKKILSASHCLAVAVARIALFWQTRLLFDCIKDLIDPLDSIKNHVNLFFRLLN